MSFLIESAARRMAFVSRTAATSNVIAVTVPRASFTTSIRLQKTVTESAKDKLKSVDRAVADKLVDGIEIGTTVKNKLKEAGSDIMEGKATGKAKELRGEAAGKAAELKGEAAGKTAEIKGEAKSMIKDAADKL